MNCRSLENAYINLLVAILSHSFQIIIYIIDYMFHHTHIVKYFVGGYTTTRVSQYSFFFISGHSRIKKNVFSNRKDLEKKEYFSRDSRIKKKRTKLTRITFSWNS